MTEAKPDPLDFDVLTANVGVQVHLTRRALWLRAGPSRPKMHAGKPSGYLTTFIVIGANPGVSQKRLADELFLDAGSIGDIVDTLEREDMVERRRDPADRRRLNLFLTDHGRAEWLRLRAKSAEIDRGMTGALTEAEVEQLLELLKRLRG